MNEPNQKEHRVHAKVHKYDLRFLRLKASESINTVGAILVETVHFNCWQIRNRVTAGVT